MKREAKKVVSYSRSFKEQVVYAVVRDGFSIAKVCSMNGIDEIYQVREWVRDYMKKRGMTRAPRTLTRRKNAPRAYIPEAVDRQLKRYEEMLLYQQIFIESMYEVADEETKKKLLEKLSPTQRRNLKKTGKLST